MPAISPRTMSFSGAPSADQARPLFEQGLTQMAYDVLIAKLPSVSQDVVTFKIIDVDPEAGSGSGTFVVQRLGQTIYIPVVMADNQLKPLDVMYHKALNVFLPLTKEWLDQVDKSGLAEMGTGVQPPTNLSKDVDIRQAVVPPVTGRFSYASDRSAEKTAGMVFDQARRQTDMGRPVFLEYLQLAPNRVKKAAAIVFEQNPRVLRAAVRTYGATKLSSAFRPLPEKLADYGGRLSSGGGLYVADENTPADIFKEVFGPGAPMAYQNAVSRGYAAKDDRKTKRALRVNMAQQWTTPNEEGAYKFIGKNGKPVKALVFSAPVQLFDRPKYDLRHSGVRRYGEEPRYDRQFALTEGGLHVKGPLPVAEKLDMGELYGTRIMKDASSGQPKVGATGVFVRFNPRGVTATEPVKIKSVATDSSGVRRVVVTQEPYGFAERELLTSPAEHGTPLIIPANERLAYLPDEFKFVSYNGCETAADQFVFDPRSVNHMVEEALVKESGVRHIVRHSTTHGWTVNSGNARGRKFAEAVDFVARETGVHADTAAALLKEAADTGRCEFWAVPEAGARRVEAFLKTAAGPAQPPPQDPSMMDPSMMMPQQPPMPTPVDMAVAEQTQSLMGQMQALQQQLAMLQMVQQRSQQIAGGGGAMAAPEAMAAAMGGPMPMGPQGVNPMLAGPGPQMGGMDPSMMGGMDPSMMGGMDPSMMGGGMPGQPMDPNGQMPQIDPTTGQPVQPPPPAMMSSEAATPEELAAQVNPQFMEQAAALQDDGAFDAAALASMAQSPAVHDLIGAYVPNLEKALDNLGRVMVTLYLDESNIKDQLGNEAYVALEDNLRNTFKGLGDLLLKINQNAVIMNSAPGSRAGGYA